MKLIEHAEQIASDNDIEGIVTHALLTFSVIDRDGRENILTLATESVGMMTHLGLATAAKLTAEGRYFASDYESNEKDEDDEPTA